MTNERVLSLVLDQNLKGKRILDLGCGTGFFSKVLFESLENKGLPAETMVFAADFSPEKYRFDKIKCDFGDFNDRLPYPDGFFDIVCCIEVIEHIEDQFKLCQEIARITKPQGIAILTTPNIMNINSRIAYLGYGMYPLFDLLPLTGIDIAGGTGHIHPVSYYYLSYMLRRNGFAAPKVFADRFKRSAIGLLILTLPLIAVMKCFYRLRVKRKNFSAYSDNLLALSAMNSLKLLASRSVIVMARKI